jgi:hypothetical protein
MTASPSEDENVIVGEFDQYGQTDTGDYIITEEFPQEVREELLLESRELMHNFIAANPGSGELYDDDGQSGDCHIKGLGDNADISVGISVSKATDGNKDGSLSVFRIDRGNTTKENTSAIVTFGPTGKLVTVSNPRQLNGRRTPLPQKEAVTFAREIIKTLEDSLKTVESF